MRDEGSNGKHNQDIESVHNSEIDFFDEIQKELENGFGFVPLLGAGISAESGVPLIPEMKAYLATCIGRALGVTGNKDDQPRRRWYPATDSWPTFRGLPRNAQVEVENRITAHLRFLRETDDSEFQVPIFQEALGALANWRSSLLFLSRIRRAKGEQIDRPLRLGPPNYDVMDAYFRYATGGKRPTLPHQMIALLSQPMRFNVLLTTNFDELIEEAFREAEILLDPIDIHVHASLPSLSHIGKRRTLIKLHGGRYGLRADYSLDEDPTPDEVENFASFFYPLDPTGKLDDKANNHLLVMGLAAEDHRVREFITRAYQHAQNAGGKPFRIFWVCYSESDYRTVCEFERNVTNKLKRPGSDSHVHKWVILRHEFTGLLLLQLWQYLTRTLPPRFAVFPSGTRISTPPVRLPCNVVNILNQRMGLFDKVGPKVRDYVKENFYSDHPLQFRLLRLTAKHGSYGVVSQGALHYFRALHNHRKCVWLSLEDVTGTDELFEHLTDAIARTAGITDWLPIVLFDQKEKAIGEINRLTEGNHEWVIFLDARDGAGNASHLFREPSTSGASDKPNGWLDTRKGQSQPANSNTTYGDVSDGTDNADDFVLLLKKLTSEKCPKVSVVLLYHQEKANEVDSGLERVLNAEGFPEPILVEEGISHIERIEPKLLKEFAPNTEEAKIEAGYSVDETLSTVLQWANCSEVDGHRRLLFLMTMCCVQRTRYPALLVSDAINSELTLENDPMRLGDRADEINAWLDQLVEKQAIRILPGGFIWMHARLKHALRIFFDLSPDDEKANQEAEITKEKPGYSILIHRIHTQLASWYDRLFRSSHDPLSGLEAVSHHLEAARFLSQKQKINQNSLTRIRDSITRAGNMLKEVRPVALSLGYPKASCRRLVHLRCHWVQAMRTQFEKASGDTNEENEQIDQVVNQLDTLVNEMLEIKRGIAREVSEHSRAFQRHRQLLEYRAMRTTKLFSKLPFYPEEFPKQQELTRLIRHILISIVCERLPDLKLRVKKFFDEAEERELQITGQEKQRLTALWESWIEDEGTKASIREFLISWDRHSTILSLATRAYPMAGSTVCRSIRRAMDPKAKEKTNRMKLRDVAAIVLSTDAKNVLSEFDITTAMTRPDASAHRYEHLIRTIKGAEDVIHNLESWRAETPTSLIQVLKGLHRLVQWVIVQVEAIHFAQRSPVPLYRDNKVVVEIEKCKSRLKSLAISADRVFTRLVGMLQLLGGNTRVSHADMSQLRQTMETQMSTILALNSDFRRSHERLERATELRPQRDPSSTVLSNGIVDLHRTQLFLIHSLNISIKRTVKDSNKQKAVTKELPIVSTMRELIGITDEETLLERSKDWLKNHKHAKYALIEAFKLDEIVEQYQNSKVDFVEHLVKIDSANRLVNDAEIAAVKARDLLVRKRKNVWWSTWLFELQIKAIEYRLLISICKRCLCLAHQVVDEKDNQSRKNQQIEDRLARLLKKHDLGDEDYAGRLNFGAPVPDFGSRDCPRGQPTIADELLLNTTRMVRLDLVRLARVIESYLLCYRGLQFLLALDPQLERLPTRLLMMRNALAVGDGKGTQGALELLKRRRDERFRMPTTVDPAVAIYVDYVIDLGNKTMASRGLEDL